MSEQTVQDFLKDRGLTAKMAYNHASIQVLAADGQTVLRIGGHVLVDINSVPAMIAYLEENLP